MSEGPFVRYTVALQWGCNFAFLDYKLDSIELW